MKQTIRQIAGYLLGGLLVLVMIPYGIYSLTKLVDPMDGLKLFESVPIQTAVIVVFTAIGFPFGIWSIITQNIVGEGGPLQVGKIEISPKTKNLVVTGPYKYTRNPMLFGACMMYFGFAAYLNSIVAVVAVVIFMTVMLIFVKQSEEKRLLADFGQSYVEYRNRVSMFIPWMPRK